ncbi:hypothetical protein BDK51DRAFT_28508 [Blyttiomyces helicus]|uniref:Uncharacterized protein n=1 Tax=Blyttiomyces helicus TaxID=388810 RepID=A0A4P9WHK0_9FUNG|nr:hypothetical protein BDK51DRAFT_28508 [Blyttiomyces helicus]|eukprot:RKO92311.1 hypothetical protein BDK51DRAFT_28508 [Blyttiomyces helicus]
MVLHMGVANFPAILLPTLMPLMGYLGPGGRGAYGAGFAASWHILTCLHVLLGCHVKCISPWLGVREMGWWVALCISSSGLLLAVSTMSSHFLTDRWGGGTFCCLSVGVYKSGTVADGAIVLVAPGESFLHHFWSHLNTPSFKLHPPLICMSVDRPPKTCHCHSQMRIKGTPQEAKHHHVPNNTSPRRQPCPVHKGKGSFLLEVEDDLLHTADACWTGGCHEMHCNPQSVRDVRTYCVVRDRRRIT